MIACGLLIAAGCGLAAAVATGPATATRPAGPIAIRTDAITADQFPGLTAEITFWAKWACILAGLALVAAIWTGWSLRTLAKNQVAIAGLIQALGAK